MDKCAILGERRELRKPLTGEVEATRVAGTKDHFWQFTRKNDTKRRGLAGGGPTQEECARRFRRHRRQGRRGEVLGTSVVGPNPGMDVNRSRIARTTTAKTAARISIEERPIVLKGVEIEVDPKLLERGTASIDERDRSGPLKRVSRRIEADVPAVGGGVGGRRRERLVDATGRLAGRHSGEVVEGGAAPTPGGEGVGVRRNEGACEGERGEQKGRTSHGAVIDRFPGARRRQKAKVGPS
ncbi:hypothetical protein OUZ56_032366, partial [Daphnia magna]